MMKRTYPDSCRGAGIDVICCVQGNTARSRDFYDHVIDDQHTGTSEGCVVYKFRRGNEETGKPAAPSAHSRKRAAARKKAARARARKVRAFRMMFFGALLVMMFSLGGIASRAQSRKAPDAYKYYDTITVGYQENFLDIVEKYDDRNYYETQRDYVKELCRINSLEYDGTSYPSVTPGTHLVVPYYSTELK